MATHLRAIKERIEDGDTAGAESALVNLLRSEYQNTDAWMLLGRIAESAARKAECYRQVLRIDPKNKRARKELEMLMDAYPELPGQGTPSLDNGHILCCPQCGGAMEVVFAGEWKDKRAKCSYCGIEVDIPDTYQRVKKKRAQEWNFNSVHTVEDTLIETRQDGGKYSEDAKSLPPDIQEMLQEIKAKGPGCIDENMLEKLKQHGVRLSLGHDAITPEILRALQGNDFNISIGGEPQSKKTIYIRKERKNPSIFGQFIAHKEDEKLSNPFLSETETLKFFGFAPAPEDTRKCPNTGCGATIPKNAKKCSWCGTEI